ncbi:hypothetical protein V8E54_011540 [Elaphomyces granulatus]
MANSIPSSSPWPYKKGTKFTLHVDTASPLFSEKTRATIEVEVQKVFEPVTMSPVMVVRLNGEPKNLEYVNFVLSGAAPKYIKYMNDDGASDESNIFDSMTEAEGETYLYERCNDLYNAETLAYRALNGLQGQSVPNLFATHIDGFRLTHLTAKVPKCYWQSICDDAVSVVNAASDCGILNMDIRPDNFVVRKIPGRTGTVYKPILLDFALSRTQGAEESNEDWNEARQIQDEERAIGSIMQHELSKHGGGYIYRRSYRYS